jgi:hypothetical protein
MPRLIFLVGYTREVLARIRTLGGSYGTGSNVA